jgi:hypothetical protein
MLGVYNDPKRPVPQETRPVVNTQGLEHRLVAQLAETLTILEASHEMFG